MDARFVTSIRRLPELTRYHRADVLSRDFVLYQDNQVEVFYAPLDWFNPTAEVAVIGLTPGWRQTEVAFRVARKALSLGASVEAAERQAKEAARFAGSMRHNLTVMLDALSVPRALGLSNSMELFEGRSELLHSTSAMRYPVFVRGKNYSGYSPTPASHAYLKSMVDEMLSPELVSATGNLAHPAWTYGGQARDPDPFAAPR